MTGFRLFAFRAFAFALLIWTGAGLHESLADHFAWWADPVAAGAVPSLAGTVNPWPFTTIALLLATVAAALSLRGYRGPGKREGVIALAGAALIIVATLGFFVPQLGVMADPAIAPDTLVAAAHRWIVLNALRTVVLFVLGWYALVALGRFGSAPG